MRCMHVRPSNLGRVQLAPAETSLGVVETTTLVKPPAGDQPATGAGGSVNRHPDLLCSRSLQAFTPKDTEG